MKTQELVKQLRMHPSYIVSVDVNERQLFGEGDVSRKLEITGLDVINDDTMQIYLANEYDLRKGLKTPIRSDELADMLDKEPCKEVVMSINRNDVFKYGQNGRSDYAHVAINGVNIIDDIKHRIELSCKLSPAWIEWSERYKVK